MSKLRGSPYGRYPSTAEPPIYAEGDIVVMANGYLGEVRGALRESEWTYKVWVPRFDSVVMANERHMTKAAAVTWL